MRALRAGAVVVAAAAVIWLGVRAGVITVSVGHDREVVGSPAPRRAASPPRVSPPKPRGEEFRAHFERYLPWPVGSVEQRLASEYGAPIAAAQDSVRRPRRLVYDNPDSLSALRRSLDLDSARVAGTMVVLQRPALSALRRAIHDAALLRKRITPRGGRTAALRDDQSAREFWLRRVALGLGRAVSAGALSQAASDSILHLGGVAQIAAVLRLEDRGMMFGLDGRKSILHSAAPPGSSQHLVGYAFDLEEHADSIVRGVLEARGFWQTVAEDEPHFTYLGWPDSTALEARGLVRKVAALRRYWVPNPPGLPVEPSRVAAVPPSRPGGSRAANRLPPR